MNNGYNITHEHINNIKADGRLIGNDDYKGMDILVTSRSKITAFVPDKTVICISIWDEVVDGGPPVLQQGYKDVLSLHFEDVVEPGPQFDGVPPEILYTYEMANKVAQFIYTHKDTDVTLLVIHCHAGINRSRSMAAAIVDHFKWPFKYSVGNKLVYDLTLEALQDFKEVV